MAGVALPADRAGQDTQDGPPPSSLVRLEVHGAGVGHLQVACPVWGSQSNCISRGLQSKCPRKKGLFWPDLGSHTMSLLLRSAGHKQLPKVSLVLNGGTQNS